MQAEQQREGNKKAKKNSLSRSPWIHRLGPTN